VISQLETQSLDKPQQSEDVDMQAPGSISTIKAADMLIVRANEL
jgi:hypothetical protein